EGRGARASVAVEVDQLGAESRGSDKQVARQVEQASVGALCITKAGEPTLVGIGKGRAVEEVAAVAEGVLGLGGNEGAATADGATEHDAAVDTRSADIGIRHFGNPFSAVSRWSM